MNTIETLYEGPLGAIEFLQCDGVRCGKGPLGYANAFHVVIPLRGSFVWHLPSDEIFADSGRVLFAGGGEAYSLSHPVGGDGSIVITPSKAVLEELLGVCDVAADHRLLRAHWLPNLYDLQLSIQMLYALCVGSDGLLGVEECLIGILATLFDAPQSTPKIGARANRTLSQAKAILQASASAKSSLSDIAKAVGVSATYLTRLFGIVEGISLHQYELKLRLAAALDVLAETDDMTGLALDLGFCSHSHLTAAFRTRFGAPPSIIRAQLKAAAERGRTGRRVQRPLCRARGGAAN